MIAEPAELAAYFLAVKYCFVVFFLLWLFSLYRIRRPGVLAAGALVLSVYGYVASALPLERPYAARPGGDRMVNLAMAATAAAGGSIFESYQVKSADHEPMWRLLMKIASLGDPANVVPIYRALPAVMMTLLALSLYFGFRGEDRDNGQSASDRRWELAFVVYAVLLLNSSPQDRFGETQTLWAMTIFLKPNHTLGLVLIPLWVGLFASSRRGWRNWGAGLLLALLSWVFLLHWSYLLVGLALYPVVAATLGRAPELGRAARVAALSLVASIPYISYLYRFYWGIGARAGDGVWPRPGPKETFFDVFSVGYAHGAIFFLSVCGIVVMIARRRKEDVVWLSLLAGSLAGWLLYLVAFGVGKALQPEEFYYYSRFLLSVAAGTGSYWVVWKASALRVPRFGARGLPVALSIFLLVMLPHDVAYWWNPPQTDRYYPISLEPIPEPISHLCQWVREELPPTAVLVADADTASWITALSGRRVLLIGPYRPPKDYEQRRDLMERMLGEPREATFREARERYEVSHLVLTRSELVAFEQGLEEKERASWPRPVYEKDGITVFQVAPSM